MYIREYRSSDCAEITRLFYDTVHIVNAKDYTKEQLDAWTSGWLDLERWDRSLAAHYSVVAVADESIVGFGDIDKTAYLDRLYVRADRQGRGIGAALCGRLEQAARGKITTHASITARPFFEKRGYKVVKEQRAEDRAFSLQTSSWKRNDDARRRRGIPAAYAEWKRVI